MQKRLAFLFFVLCLSQFTSAQDVFKITFISDVNNESNRFFEEMIKEEIGALLNAKYTLNYTTIFADQNSIAGIDAAINEAYNEDSDIVISLGVNACDQIAKLPVFTKPTILAFILDNELQQISITPQGTSGIPNMTYIQSPFDIARDLQTLYEIIPFQKISIISTKSVNQTDFQAFFNKTLAFSNATFEEIPVGNDASTTLGMVSKETDAVYLLPVFDELSRVELKKLLEGIAGRGIPVFSLLSSPMMELGAYASYDTDGNLQRIPRRVAINVMKIIEGQNPSELSVTMDHFTENLVINMKTVKASKLYPSWETLAKGILVNVTDMEQPGRVLTLQSAIAEGLQNNLGLKIAEKGVKIVEQDVAIAKSNYLPQVDASATALTLDKTTIQNSFGMKGYFNLSATASLSQLILSEPALANIAIQKMLLEGEKQSRNQAELDVILDVADAYLGILQTVELVKLRNENVTVTRKNYDISQAKEQVGYGGTSDVYRWQSELALDNVDLNTTQAQFESARYNLNALLNRPIKENFELGDVLLSDSILLVMDNRLFPLINNQGDIEVFSDFLVEEAFRNLPEVKQLEASVMAQERSLLSQKRAFYLPTVALSSEYEYPIDNSGYPEGVIPFDVKPSFNAAVALQFPIFQGNSRRRQKEQAMVTLGQIQDQMANLRNNLELQVRSSLQVAGASFSNLELSREAATAAQKNFEFAQNFLPGRCSKYHLAH